MDEEIKSLVTEVQGRNLQTAYLSFPLNPEDNLGISQPIFNMFLKKTGEHFFCKITEIDDKSIRRQIFLTTFRKEMKVRVFSGCVPIRLPTSWDYIIVNLAEFTYQLFGTKYVKTVEIQIYTKCRIRRVYFSDKLYSQEELPCGREAEVSGESEAAPSINEVMADKLPGVPAGSGHQGRGSRFNNPRSGTSRQPTAAAHEYQSGFRSILSSLAWSPLKFWRTEVNTGHVKRVKDEDIKSLAIELQGRNMRTTYISYPHDPEDNVGIRQPILNLLMKNTGGDCGLEITVTDDNSIRRRIFLSTFRKEMKASVFSGCVPLRLSTYWDYIIINLAELTHQLFGSKYVKTLKIQIHANCRIQRVYFSDRLYSQQELPHDWKAEILVENEAAPSINEVMASGVPSGSGHWGHGNRYNELRSGTCCQPTAAALNYQPGFRSILYSTGWSLLKFWNIEVKNGHVKSVMDEDIRSFSIEVQGSSQTTYISFPHDLEDNLGIRQPIFNMLLKKSGEDFFCKITVTDEKSVQRQIFLSTFRKEMKARVFSGCVPIRLSTSWDYIIINLAEVTQQLFGTKYVKTVKIQIHANCRIRRVYFSDRLYSHEELPRDFKVKNLALSKMAHDIDKEMADQPSGVPTGSEYQGLDSGYNEPRSEMSCQTTAAAQDCTGWSSLKLWDIEVNTEHVKDFMEEDIKSLATEERGRNVPSSYSLDIRRSIFNMLLKMPAEYFLALIKRIWFWMHQKLFYHV
ncbi:uncharacterized protein LOC130527883 isoform X1 [Takifugu flavidus]|uniref:uncharacterized protein LOC130527883 isoform X1 n=2 Tax=Takifugu flavidus TaxID=433684 RepID=UPI0025442FDA|nr:uncharacterized protein LOC130527883 isoform X1 [Takifugu flavidus]